MCEYQHWPPSIISTVQQYKSDITPPCCPQPALYLNCSGIPWCWTRQVPCFLHLLFTCPLLAILILCNLREFFCFCLLSWTRPSNGQKLPYLRTTQIRFFGCTRPKVHRFWIIPHTQAFWTCSVHIHEETRFWINPHRQNQEKKALLCPRLSVTLLCYFLWLRSRQFGRG